MAEVSSQGERLEEELLEDIEPGMAAPDDEGLDDSSALARAGLSEDVGELDFTYDDTLLQADEEEEPVLSETPHKESQEPESDPSKQEQTDHKWASSSANALPLHNNDMPAHSRAGVADHSDRQRIQDRQRPRRPGMPNRADLNNRDYQLRGRGHMQVQGPGSRHSDGPWTPAMSSAPNTRHQGAPDRPGTSSQFSRLPQPAAKPPEVMEFDPNILWKAMGVVPPSFAPVAEDTNHKRSHDQMQNQMPPIPEDLVRSLLQMQQQQHPNGQGNMPHQSIRPGVPPPRPPSGPPPAGPPPMPHGRHPNMMPGFAGVPDFSPMNPNGMDYQGFEPQHSGSRPHQPGWSLSHGMDGASRANKPQEPMLAAGMVWDDVNAMPSFSGRDQPGHQTEHFRPHISGSRGGFPRPLMQPQGPRPPLTKSPPTSAPAKPSQDAIAAAKAKFEQQQKENERIAEMNKRQRLGLPAERKPVAETEIQRLKRQIAEKEAAVKAAQAQMLASKAAPSALQSRPSSASPSPASPPDLASPSPKPQQQVQTKALPAEPSNRSRGTEPKDGHARSARAEHAEPSNRGRGTEASPSHNRSSGHHRTDAAEHAEHAEPSGKGRGTEASPSHVRSSGHQRHSRDRSRNRSRDRSRDKSRDKIRRSDDRSSHARQNGGSSSSHQHRSHDARQRDTSRDRSPRRRNSGERKDAESHRSPHKSSAQALQRSQSRSPLSQRHHARPSVDTGRLR